LFFKDLFVFQRNNFDKFGQVFIPVHQNASASSQCV
jgi:hypothetical protein